MLKIVVLLSDNDYRQAVQTYMPQFDTGQRMRPGSNWQQPTARFMTHL